MILTMDQIKATSTFYVFLSELIIYAFLATRSFYISKDMRNIFNYIQVAAIVILLVARIICLSLYIL